MSDEEPHISHMAHFVDPIPKAHNDCALWKGIAVSISRCTPGNLVEDLICKNVRIASSYQLTKQY